MKKQLIEQYNKGLLTDKGVYNPSMFDAYILVEWNDEFVFGYYQYQKNEKEFFKVQTKILNDDWSFKVGNKTIKASQVMRMR